jgi:hypothetical protein
MMVAGLWQSAAESPVHTVTVRKAFAEIAQQRLGGRWQRLGIPNAMALRNARHNLRDGRPESEVIWILASA